MGNERRDRIEQVAALLVGTRSVPEACDRAEELIAEIDKRMGLGQLELAAKLDTLLLEVCGVGATHETHDIVQAVRDIQAERDALAQEKRRLETVLVQALEFPQ